MPVINAAVNSYSRVFLIEGRARPDHRPVYQSCLSAGSLEQNFGDVTDIECPDPNQYGHFVTVGQIRGAEERVTITLSGRFAIDVASSLARLAKKGCPADLHVHFGTTQTPNDFRSFTKAVVIEDAFATNYSTDDLGTLSSDNQNPVGESSNFSGQSFYEIMPVGVSQQASDLTLNQVIDGTACDPRNCGADESDGCQKFFFVQSPTSGSPGTAADVVYTLDGGATWNASEITAMGSTEEPTGIACFGTYLVILNYTGDSLVYADRSEFDGVTVVTYTEVSTGIEAAGSPNAISSVGARAFIVGDGGYVYLLEDVASGVSVSNAGVATSEDLNDVDALDDSNAVAVGDNGAVIYTTDGATWQAAAVPVASNLNAVLMLSEKTWLVGAANGNLYYTVNGGVSWTLKGFVGSGSGSVTALAKSTDGLLWLAHQTAATRARLLRSYNGGYDWVVTPEGVGSIPLADQINAIATCAYDANVALAGGLADDAAAGIIMLAQPS
jgi:hypothetical protein